MKLNKKKITRKATTAIKRAEKKVIQKETYEHYKKNYNSRKAAVHKAGRTMNQEYDGETILTETEWEFYHNTSKEKLTNKQIIDMQAYTRSESQAKNIQKALKRAGITNLSLSDIKYGAGDEYLEIISDEYQRLIDNGYTSQEAKAYIGYEYFGSPK